MQWEWVQGFGQPLLGALDLILGGMAVFMVFLKRGYTLAEAGVYAVAVAFMGLSLLLDLADSAGMPGLVAAARLLVPIGSGVFLLRHRALLSRLRMAAVDFDRGSRASLVLLALLWAYLGLLAIGNPSTLVPCSSVLQASAEKSMACCSLSGQHRSLLLLFGRHAYAPGAGLVGMLSYVAICLATYALARRYAWPPTALVAAMIAAGMPRFVYLATTPGCEILPAAIAVFCLLALYRTVERPNPVDFALLIAGLVFGVGPHLVSLTLQVLLAALAVVLLVRRHGAVTWQSMISGNPAPVLGAITSAMIFCAPWRWVSTFSGWPRKIPAFLPEVLAANRDGIVGAAANLTRYLVQMIHLTRPVDRLVESLCGRRLEVMLVQLVHVFLDPIWADRGAALPFENLWTGTGPLAGFGPLAFFLILPACFYAALRGPRRLKAVAVALAGYLYLVALIAAWHPLNLRLLTPFLALSAFMTAFLLPPWRMTAGRRVFLQTVSLVLLAYAVGLLPHWFF